MYITNLEIGSKIKGKKIHQVVQSEMLLFVIHSSIYWNMFDLAA